MKTVRLTGAVLESAVNAAKLLKLNNSLLADATKQVETAKKAIAEILKDYRGIEVETLPIGEMVMIEGVLLLKINSQNKFDSKQFALDNPVEFAKYKKDFATKRFDSLVSAE
jgi:hypothetical protein